MGKVRLASTPPQNHWWNVPLYVDARGLTTRRLRSAATDFDIAFDFADHRLVVRTSRGEVESFALADGLSVAAFHERLFALLHGLGIEVAIKGVPFGIPITTPFAEDAEHHSYDAGSVERYWSALSWIEWVLLGVRGLVLRQDESRAPLLARPRPRCHALLRRPRPGAAGGRRGDAGGLLARGHQLRLLAGRRERAAGGVLLLHRARAGRAHRPTARRGRRVDGRGIGSLALLPYDAVRAAADPRGTLLAFLQSAYEAGTAAAGWPAGDLHSSWCPPAVASGSGIHTALTETTAHPPLAFRQSATQPRARRPQRMGAER